MTYVDVEFFVVGQAKNFGRPSMSFHYYCGKYLGKFFDYFSIAFAFLNSTVMAAGAGAVFEERYGLSRFARGVGLAVVVGIRVWFGLKSLVDVIGKIGPVIVLVLPFSQMANIDCDQRLRGYPAFGPDAGQACMRLARRKML